MKITCTNCGFSAPFDTFATADPARFHCAPCGMEWGLAVQPGRPHRARTIVYHDPRQAALLDLAHEGDEAAVDELFKLGVEA